MIKIVQPVQIETATLAETMAVKIPKELQAYPDAQDWFFFLDLAQVKNLKIKSLDLNELRFNRDLRRYYYYKEDLTKLSDKLAPNINDFFEELEIIGKQNSLELLAHPNFDPSKLFYFYDDAHLLYEYRSDLPLSRPYLINYIGGVTSRDYDLTRARKILEKNPWVTELNHITIPYYNNDSGNDTALEFVVKLPQKVYNRVVRHYRDKKNEKYWTVRLKESFTWACYLNKNELDVLKLKPALLKKPKQQ